MAVHAHPDDEATSTGGVLARYSAEGVTTVLVTCTDGALGDAGAVKPGQDGHQGEAVVATRAAELAESCRILGITHAHQLGFHDSGMMGWPQNDLPGSFWSTPIDGPTEQLARLIEQYRPDVVVTYDANGFYGHPDHIQAHRITVEALRRTGSDARLFFSTIRRSTMEEFRRRMVEGGMEIPDDDASDAPETPPMGVPDDEIAADVDCTPFAQQKFDALAAHASQVENIFFLRLPMDVFTAAMGRETFVRADVPRPERVESDLFAGLRD
ncbi:PIG-L family deacetylase [Nakamurella flavida]|nr:PIG-L family deacetylase [Nakamurella flavida]